MIKLHKTDLGTDAPSPGCPRMDPRYYIRPMPTPRTTPSLLHHTPQRNRNPSTSDPILTQSSVKCLGLAWDISFNARSGPRSRSRGVAAAAADKRSFTDILAHTPSYQSRGLEQASATATRSNILIPAVSTYSDLCQSPTTLGSTSQPQRPRSPSLFQRLGNFDLLHSLVFNRESVYRSLKRLSLIRIGSAKEVVSRSLSIES